MIPVFHFSKCDDGSVLFEMIIKIEEQYDIRVCFTLENKEEESGWFIVAKDGHGELEMFQELFSKEFIDTIKARTLSWNENNLLKMMDDFEKEGD